MDAANAAERRFTILLLGSLELEFVASSACGIAPGAMWKWTSRKPALRLVVACLLV
jgi:hypothetical protein